MSKKLIVFDFDGPIVDSWALSYERAERDWPGMTEAEHRNLFNGNIIEELGKLGLRKYDYDQERKYMQESFWPRKLKLGPVEGMAQVIESLEKYPMVINTSSSSRKVGVFLDDNNLSRFFSKIYGPELSTSKADRFRLIFKDYSVRPEDCLFITDTLGDVIEAEEAGVKSILVTWGYQGRGYFRDIEDKVIAIVDTPEELLSIIDKFELRATQK